MVFAQRGGGKSALRIRLATIALPQKANAKTIAVECTDFSWLVGRYRKNNRSLTEEDYIHMIMHQALSTLYDLFLPPKSMLHSVSIRQNRAERLARLASLPPFRRAEMAQLIRNYAPHLLGPIHLSKSFYLLAPDIDVSADWPSFRDAVSNQHLGEYLAQSELADNPMVQFLGELCDEPCLDTADPYESWLSPFEKLVQLGSHLKIDSWHFLFDRLDEMQLFANDFAEQVQFLEPLLAYLNLLDLPGIVFKFFLTQELKPILEGDTAVRDDRLLQSTVTVRWTQDQLQDLFRQRLLFFSENDVSSLSALCIQEGESIEQEMINLAYGSPRRLLTAAKLLVETHVRNAQPDTLISPDDWKEARKELTQIIPPKIIIDLDAKQIEVAGVKEKLTKTEANILQVLVDNNGFCDREELIEEVWPSENSDAVSNYAVDQAFSRLRRKLGDDGRRPRYLQTRRGSGFHLSHYELSE